MFSEVVGLMLTCKIYVGIKTDVVSPGRGVPIFFMQNADTVEENSSLKHLQFWVSP